MMILGFPEVEFTDPHQVIAMSSIMDEFSEAVMAPRINQRLKENSLETGFIQIL